MSGEDISQEKLKDFKLCEGSDASWYRVRIGKTVNDKIVSNWPVLDTVITHEESGNVLMRFCCKGYLIELVFKPTDIAARSSFTGMRKEIRGNSIEEVLKIIAEEAKKQDI